VNTSGGIFYLRAVEKRQHLDFSSDNVEKSLVLLRFSPSENVLVNKIYRRTYSQALGHNENQQQNIYPVKPRKKRQPGKLSFSEKVFLSYGV